VDTATNCPGVVWDNASTQTPITGKIVKLKEGAASTVTGLTALTWSSDFLLAAAYQDSAPSENSRGTEPVNFCAIQVKAFTAATDTYTFSETSGLNGVSKCTHIVQTALAIGGPAF